jgi:hypothetical protein
VISFTIQTASPYSIGMTLRWLRSILSEKTIGAFRESIHEKLMIESAGGFESAMASGLCHYQRYLRFYLRITNISGHS